jgi:DeoR/GlpR family transcriptional regulator of sugar metabolism
MGVTGVHPEIGLTTGDAEEAAVKRAICRLAAETVVLASREKLGAASPFAIVPVTAVTTLLVEQNTDDATISKYRDLGVMVVAADPKSLG